MDETTAKWSVRNCRQRYGRTVILIDIFASVTSYVLSGLKIYLVEKQFKQVREQKTKGLFGRTAAAPL
ncbi:MAG TPA: hypothetical protein VFR94_04820 [Nitrososphaeraceae archaeon]|nr:hypothetical protein [Nitrososphaeraceae archaeon]